MGGALKTSGTCDSTVLMSIKQTAHEQHAERGRGFKRYFGRSWMNVPSVTIKKKGLIRFIFPLFVEPVGYSEKILEPRRDA